MLQLKPLLHFQSKKYDALRAFKNVRPASVKKLKKRKSYGISATSTPMAAGKRVAKTNGTQANDQSLGMLCTAHSTYRH